MPVGPYFKIGYAVLLLFLIIYLGTLIDFLFQPVVITVKTLFPPIVLSGVLYYLCRPLVRVLHAKLKLPQGIAILAIYAGTAGLLSSSCIRRALPFKNSLQPSQIIFRSFPQKLKIGSDTFRTANGFPGFSMGIPLKISGQSRKLFRFNR